jgi:hypothetical protein
MDKRPAIGIPGPAGDGVIDKCRPSENEEKERTKMSAFGEASNS